MKLLAFDQAVNVTLGLPIIRTSPDHGTAFDIVGRKPSQPRQHAGGDRAGDQPGGAAAQQSAGKKIARNQPVHVIILTQIYRAGACRPGPGRHGPALFAVLSNDSLQGTTCSGYCRFSCRAIAEIPAMKPFDNFSLLLKTPESQRPGRSKSSACSPPLV